MKRRFGPCTFGLILAMACAGLPTTVRGADADVLKAVPENAWAVLFIRNLGEFDQKGMALCQQLNVEPMSLLMLAKSSLGLMTGVNDSGPAAVVLMPGQIMMPQQSMAVLLPTQDYSALLANLGAEDAGEGLSRVTIAAQPAYIAQHGNFAVAAPMPETVKAIVAAGEGVGIAANWSTHQRERFSQDDITLALNLKSVLADPGISGMLMGLAAMSGQQLAPEELQTYEAVTVSVRLERDGARLGLYVGFKEGSEKAQIWASGETTTKTMLTGLPGEKYALAFGTMQDAASAQKWADSVRKDFEKTAQMLPPEVDRAKMTETVGIMADMFRDMRDLAVSVSAVPAGGEGLVAMTKVVTFEKGAAEKCSRIGEIIQTIGMAMPIPQVQQALQYVKYSAGAESVGGVNVDHLTIAVDQIEGVNPESYRQLKQIVGPEGLVFRVAAIDDQHVAATLGGGTARLQQVIELVKGNAAPLSANDGVKKAAAMLPNNRYFEGYLAPDTTMHLMTEIAKAVGEGPAPFTMPAVDAPLAMVLAPVGKNAVQADIAVPMSFIVAAKNAAATMAAPAPGPQVNAGY
jgi:hypothetical protein